MRAFKLFEERRAWVPASQTKEDDRANDGWRRKKRNGMEGRHFHLRLFERPEGTLTGCEAPEICWGAIASHIFCRQ
jgi:hypothetical protein